MSYSFAFFTLYGLTCWIKYIQLCLASFVVTFNDPDVTNYLPSSAPRHAVKQRETGETEDFGT